MIRIQNKILLHPGKEPGAIRIDHTRPVWDTIVKCNRPGHYDLIAKILQKEFLHETVLRYLFFHRSSTVHSKSICKYQSRPEGTSCSVNRKSLLFLFHQL